MMTGYGLDCQGLIPGRGREFCLCHHVMVKQSMAEGHC